MRILLLAVAVVWISGCGHSTTTLAGGKPVSHWVEALQNPDPKLRKEAAFKLGNVGDADAAVVPALRQALADADPAVRGEAILALVKCGPKAAECVPVLAELRERDADPRVRDYAVQAIERLQKK